MDRPFTTTFQLPRTVTNTTWHTIGVLVVFLGSTLPAFSQASAATIWNMWYNNQAYILDSEESNVYHAADNGSATLTTSENATKVNQAVFYPATGGSFTYTDNGDGTLSLTGGVAGNLLQAIGYTVYASSGSSATPQNDAVTCFNRFTYSLEPYTKVRSWYGPNGEGNIFYHGAAGGVALGQCDGNPDNLGNGSFRTLLITPSNGATATYAPVGDGLKKYILTTPNATATANALTSIEGHDTFSSGTAATGFTITVPVPFHNFVYNDVPSPLLAISWTEPTYYYYDNTNTPEFASNGIYGYATIFWDSTGSFDQLYMYGNGSTGLYDAGVKYGRPGTFHYLSGENLLWMVDGQPYVHDGDFVVPAPSLPVSTVNTFVYQGETYTFSGDASWVDGQASYQFHGAAGGNAIAQWDPSSPSNLPTLTIHSSTGTTKYVDGASSGYVGAYMLADGSDGPNALSWVNNVAFSVNGNVSGPFGSSQNSGNLVIQGDQFSLGQWTGDTTHVGMTLSFYDGGTNYETNIVSASSRPLTDWSWEHASSDNPNSIVAMELGASHKLQLYPVDQTASATGVAPTVVLDPNPNGLSRFDGPVRIAPQGDLSMGTFTMEPTPLP